MLRLSISIDVPDLAQGVAFYVDALGCEKVRHRGDDMMVLSTDNAQIYLQQRSPGSSAVKGTEIVRSYLRHWTPVHLDFLRSDVPAVVDRIQRFGGTVEGGERGDWGAIAYCVDPFGNGFCVIDESD